MRQDAGLRGGAMMTAARNGHDRINVINEASATIQRDIVAAAAFDLSVIDRHGITYTMFDDPAAQAAFGAIQCYRRQHREVTQAPASALIRFVEAVPEIRGWFSDLTITTDELPMFLDVGNRSIDFVAGNVEALKEQVFERKRRQWAIDHERDSRDRYIRELKEYATYLETHFSPAGALNSEILTLGELIEQNPELDPAVIEGIIRRGEIGNLISKSKVGKSWMVYGMLLSIVTGSKWLGKFWCRAGRCFLIDNELRKKTLSRRLRDVTAAMGINWRDIEGQVEILSLRGKLRDIHQLGDVLNSSIKGKFAAVFLDAGYKFYPKNTSENDNADMTEFYTRLDSYAEETDAAIINVVHATKGTQTGKDVTDVGSGAGAISRSVDSHLIFRQHEQPNCAVMESALRSFAPMEPFVTKFAFPLWTLAEDEDPALLKGTKQARDNESKQQRLDDKRDRVIAFLGRSENRQTGASESGIKNGTGISVGLLAVLNSLVDDEKLISCTLTHKGNKKPIPGWKIPPNDDAAGLPDGSAGRFSVSESGSRLLLTDGLPKGKSVRLPADRSLPELPDGFSPEDDSSNQTPNGKRKPRRKSPKARKSPA